MEGGRNVASDSHAKRPIVVERRKEKERKKTNVFNRKTCETTLLNELILCKLKDADKAHS